MVRRHWRYVLIALLLVFIIVDTGVATWLLAPRRTSSYVVQPGERLAQIADRFGLHEQAIVSQNSLRPGLEVQSGQVLLIPTPPLGLLLEWQVQLAGLGATLTGVLIGIWLFRLNGLLPGHFSLSLVAIPTLVALSHFLAAQISLPALPAGITPSFILDSVKDGFAWTAVLLLFSRALSFDSGTK